MKTYKKPMRTYKISFKTYRKLMKTYKKSINTYENLDSTFDEARCLTKKTAQYEPRLFLRWEFNYLSIHSQLLTKGKTARARQHVSQRGVEVFVGFHRFPIGFICFFGLHRFPIGFISFV